MKNFKRVFMIGAKYCGKCKSVYLATLLSYYGYSICQLILPIVEAKIIDSIAYSKSVESVVFYSVLSLIIYLSFLLLFNCYRIEYNKLQGLTGNMYFTDMNIFLHNTSMKYLGAHDYTYLLNRVNDACNFTPILFIYTTLNVLRIFITLFFSLYMIFTNHWLIGIITLSCFALEYISYVLSKNKLYKNESAIQEDYAIFKSKKHEQYKDCQFIKTHGVDEIYNKKFEDGYKSLIKHETHIFKFKYSVNSIPDILYSLSKLSLFIICGYSIINGKLTLGVLTMLIQYLQQANNSSQELYELGGTYQQFLAAFNKIEEFKTAYSHKDGDIMPEHIDSIEVENLSFDYDDKPIYRDYNLKLEKGKLYGLDGENGAGKSTLLNLMIGLYMGDYKGKICYNGIDINEINLTKCKQKLIGVTEQEPLLMKDTLYNNICLTEHYSREDIYKYAEIIGLKPYFNKLPDGLDTEINDKSTNISGGEKQKISILRQLLKNPDVMIFDEPTSALDVDSVKLFAEYIEKIKNDKIIIMISHDERMKKLYDETLFIKKCTE